ncbi:MAG: hypothetical protein AAF310_02285 [Myxococcota bacterium]
MMVIRVVSDKKFYSLSCFVTATTLGASPCVSRLRQRQHAAVILFGGVL